MILVTENVRLVCGLGLSCQAIAEVAVDLPMPVPVSDCMVLKKKGLYIKYERVYTE